MAKIQLSMRDLQARALSISGPHVHRRFNSSSLAAVRLSKVEEPVHRREAL
jgi:hypothetical protein